MPRRPDRTHSDSTNALLVATDLSVGVVSEATRLSLRVGARGRNATVAAGRLVSSPFGAVFDFRGGQCSRIRAFRDHGEALQAAGLTE